MNQNRMQMTGLWQGTYSFRSRKLQRHIGSVPFLMELIEDERGNFRGEVEDSLDEGGAPGRGAINGYRILRRLKWLKLMPIHSVLSIQRTGPQRIVYEQQSEWPMVYTGEIAPEGGIAHGKWRYWGWRGVLMHRGTWEAQHHELPFPD